MVDAERGDRSIIEPKQSVNRIVTRRNLALSREGARKSVTTRTPKRCGRQIRRNDALAKTLNVRPKRLDVPEPLATETDNLQVGEPFVKKLLARPATRLHGEKLERVSTQAVTMPRPRVDGVTDLHEVEVGEVEEVHDVRSRTWHKRRWRHAERVVRDLLLLNRTIKDRSKHAEDVSFGGITERSRSHTSVERIVRDDRSSLTCDANILVSSINPREKLDDVIRLKMHKWNLTEVRTKKLIDVCVCVSVRRRKLVAPRSERHERCEDVDAITHTMSNLLNRRKNVEPALRTFNDEVADTSSRKVVRPNELHERMNSIEDVAGLVLGCVACTLKIHSTTRRIDAKTVHPRPPR